jgi:hypothetical protein
MPGTEAKIIFHTQAPLISLVTLIITSLPYRFAVHFYVLPWIPYFFFTLAQVISAVIFWKDIVLIIYYPLTVPIYECWCWRYVLFRMKRRFWQIKVWNSNSESSLSFLAFVLIVALQTDWTRFQTYLYDVRLLPFPASSDIRMLIIPLYIYSVS